MRKLDYHPFALLLPMADADDMSRLHRDIRRHGVRVPIVLFDGQILDGRSRYKVCRDLGVPAPTVNFDGTASEALALVASYNLHRRHLNASQKAIVAAKIANELEAVSEMDRPEARRYAAEVTGASRSTLERAARIEEHQPRVAQAILAGKETVGGVTGRSQTTCPRCGHRW